MLTTVNNLNVSLHYIRILKKHLQSSKNVKAQFGKSSILYPTIINMGLKVKPQFPNK